MLSLRKLKIKLSISLIHLRLYTQYRYYIIKWSYRGKQIQRHVEKLCPGHDQRFLTLLTYDLHECFGFFGSIVPVTTISRFHYRWTLKNRRIYDYLSHVCKDRILQSWYIFCDDYIIQKCFFKCSKYHDIFCTDIISREFEKKNP